MKIYKRYSTEVRERAVRLVREAEKTTHPSGRSFNQSPARLFVRMSCYDAGYASQRQAIANRLD